MAIPNYSTEAIVKFFETNDSISSIGVNFIDVSDEVFVGIEFKDTIDLYTILNTIAKFQTLCLKHEFVSFVNLDNKTCSIKLQYLISKEEQAQIAQYEKDLEDKFHAEILNYGH